MRPAASLLFTALLAVMIGCTKPENPAPAPEEPKQELIVFEQGTNMSPVANASGDTITVLFTANAAWKASVAYSAADTTWCEVSPKTGGAGSAKVSIVAKENLSFESRVANVKIEAAGGGNQKTIKLQQSGIDKQTALKEEKEALIAFYKAANGDKWKTKENWCSDKPVSEWYGVTVSDSEGGRVVGIDLWSNNLSGDISAVIKALIPLKKLSKIWIGFARFSGELPEEIGDLQSLTELTLSDAGLSGPLPQSMGKLTNLKYLSIGNAHIDPSLETMNQFTGTLQCLEPIFGNLTKFYASGNKLEGSLPEWSDNLQELDVSYNNFEGSIPESHVKAFDRNQNGVNYFVSHNELSGAIPASFVQHKNWMMYWYDVIPQRAGYGFDRVDLPAFNNTVQCYGGEMLNLGEEYKKNKYTIIFRWEPSCVPSQKYKLPIYELYQKYKDKGLGLIATSLNKYEDKYIPLLTTFMPDVKCFWEKSTYDGPYNNNTYGSAWFYLFRFPVTPSFYVVDSNGNVVFLGIETDGSLEYSGAPYPESFEQFHNRQDDIYNYVAQLFGDEEFVPSENPSYVSQDFSRDGEVVTLQRATEGKGINVVLMGDGYSDRQIESGLYKADMTELFNSLFNMEPYKSFRKLFNVYYVNVVSATESYDYNHTALKGWFGEGTTVGGDNEKCFEYAQKVLTPEQMDDALLVTLMNAYDRRGTCYMYSTTNDKSDWGSGVSVSYFTKGTADGKTSVEQLLHHEANGHGFAKLGDEYAYEQYGQITSDAKESLKLMEKYGWYKNIDFTSDPAQVKWAKFLADTRYQNDGLGVFEGGGTYWRGVWRPTYNSIMNEGTGGFNAPSREAIYYRIHKLAYGADWQYDYEKFVEWDAINRKSEAQTKSMPLVLDPEKSKLPHTPPVVIPHSWREAK